MKFSVQSLVAQTLLSGLLVVSAAATPRHANTASLSSNSREIFRTAMEWGDRYYDAQTHLCNEPPSPEFADLQSRQHSMVRESAWYAVGLLLRDGQRDRARAAEILRAVVAEQYHSPGKAWDGTFRRYPGEPEPGDKAVMWRDYDPNWRVFIGTTFALILNEYPDRIPHDLVPQMTQSIDDAIAGEMKQGRLLPTYTNISLMYGFLWNYAAVHGNHPEWTAPAVSWQENVYKLYKQHDAFWEYNSPTYSGVDLYALALWRDYGFTPRMRSMGSEMEAGQWRAIADLYNANLRNISGPYDRAYGMNMQNYVSIVGLWLRTVLDSKEAPLTGFHPPVDHVEDLWITPLIVVVDTHIPADAMKEFLALQAEHAVRRPIADGRIATAWIGKDLIYGGEITDHTRGVDAHSQFHPVTVQWKMPDGAIGWIQLTRCPAIDASADRSGIRITAAGDIAFRFRAGAAPQDLKSEQWNLPGLTIHVKADAKDFTVVRHGPFLDATYRNITAMTLTMDSNRTEQAHR